ncbi:MAG: response regulator [Gammaproteobacteria bacterium]|nr:response regulator [Gammaproteobacteria bacterium]
MATMMDSKHILLVIDDEPGNRRLAHHIFDQPYHVISANDGAAGLKLFLQHAPCVVLLDVIMPGEDGYTICRRMRELDETGLSKILLVSGKAMIDEVLQGYACGADDYITKPFIRQELEAKVSVFTKLLHAEKSLRNINQTLEKEVKTRTEQLLQAEKMAFIGTHTAQIVHNLSNPLHVISLNSKILHKQYPDDQSLFHIYQAAEELNQIVDSILSSARADLQSHTEDVDLNIVIEKQLQFFKLDKKFAYRIKTSTELMLLPSFLGVPNHFNQLIANLIKNAVDATNKTQNPTLLIKTQFHHGFVECLITDNGCGIRHQDQEHIFEAMFTTKQHGTGLGLAYCKQILEAYGGAIGVQSEINKGTTFFFKIPVNKSVAIAIA